MGKHVGRVLGHFRLLFCLNWNWQGAWWLVHEELATYLAWAGEEEEEAGLQPGRGAGSI